jgi:hypothetical protein
MLNSNGNPISKAINQAVPNPVSTPKAPPIAVTITGFDQKLGQNVFAPGADSFTNANFLGPLGY